LCKKFSRHPGAMIDAARCRNFGLGSAIRDRHFFSPFVDAIFDFMDQFEVLLSGMR
jgi:hypothetical protein